jgi:outer membrane usher protein
VPYVSPYRQNGLTLNPVSLPENVELERTTQNVVPTRGAVVRAEYQTSLGFRALMTLTRADGKPVPFGATVTHADSDDAQGFIVGDGGQVYLSGLQEKGNLVARWGDGAAESCRVDYAVSDEPTDASGIQNMEYVCQGT